MLGFKGKVAGPFGTIVVESRDKLKSAMYGAFKTNFCYMKTLEAIMPNTHSFDMVVDIGACVGDLPLAFSKISRRILAVEPGASNFSSLEANIAANGISNVDLAKLAAHDVQEPLALGGIDSNRRVLASQEGEIVQGIPLDQLFSKFGIERVNLLKIDVQGHELHVLRGTHQFLREKRVEVLVVEAHEACGVSAREVTSLMMSYGYSRIMDSEYIFRQRQLYFVPNGQAAYHTDDPLPSATA